MLGHSTNAKGDYRTYRQGPPRAAIVTGLQRHTGPALPPWGNQPRTTFRGMGDGMGHVYRLGISVGFALCVSYAAVAEPVARNADPFTTVTTTAQRLAGAGQKPIVIFDLDDTLFSTAPRTLRILQEWSRTPAGKPYAAALAKVTVGQVGYGFTPNLQAAGVPKTVWPAVTTFWRDRFFTSQYLQYDTPIPGAVAFVKACQASGARLVYLTGRSQKMQAGTEQTLKTGGFPWDPAGLRTTLIVKTDGALNDLDYKAVEVAVIKQWGTVVGSIDNEPGNDNMFHKLLPDATTIFLDTPHSADAPPLDAGIPTEAAYPAAK